MPNNNKSLVMPEMVSTQISEASQLPRYLQKHVSSQVVGNHAQTQAITEIVQGVIDGASYLYGYGMYKVLQTSTAAEMLVKSAEKLRGGPSSHHQAAYEQNTVLFLSTINALQQVAAQSLVEVANQVPHIQIRDPTFWDYLKGEA